MSDKLFPITLYETGITDLISVIPPGAQLSPKSKILQSQVGKVPGRRGSNGLYAGYDWRRAETSLEDVQQWCVEGSNVGLRASRWPAVDIDCMDDRLARIIEDAAYMCLGAAPLRVGKPPKRLLMYRTDEPFARMRLLIERGGQHHLVEILGDGQQYVVHGIHPSTLLPYQWFGSEAVLPIDGRAITLITRESADAFLTYVADTIKDLGIGTARREGDGRLHERASAGDQNELRAPSLDLLRDCVRVIPNDEDTAPTRDAYIKVGYAIRAACGDEIEDGLSIFCEWAGKHEKDGRVSGNAETWITDWRRMQPPFIVGWPWLAEQARAYGFDTAALDFDAITEEATEDVPVAPLHSEQWLAEKIVERRRGVLRFVPQKEQYLVWTGTRWQPDAELLAEEIIKQELKSIASDVGRRGATAREIKDAQNEAKQIATAFKVRSVAQLLRSDRDIAVSMEALDHDPWIINTPGGVVDLRTGALGPSDPDALCTRTSSVPPDFANAHPEWDRFLTEATGGDTDLVEYLQRLCGYALTGSTREQQLTFIWGPGGNGKGKFIEVLNGILGDYARVASMDTFTASTNEKHSTDLAMLVGARLVSASETQSGKRWDEQRVKSLSGGDRVTARFMRQDNFTFMPQFKLVFVGNYKPEVRDVDAAMRRRIQMVPFVVTPASVDNELGSKLQAEWPQIFAWMIAGCLAWQKQGLAPPSVVQQATKDYFADEDAVGRWVKDALAESAEGSETTHDLFQSWREWANANGEFVGSVKRLSSALVSRKIPRWQHPDSRRMGFAGLVIKDRLGVSTEL